MDYSYKGENMSELFLIIIVMYFFFSYILGGTTILLIASCFGLILLFLLKTKFNIPNFRIDEKLYLLYGTISIMFMIHYTYLINSLFFGGIILIFTIVKYIISRSSKLYDLLPKILYVFSAIHLAATIIQYFDKGLVDKINKVILPYSSYLVNYSQVSRGKYPGITSQVGMNAFFITVFIGFSYALYKASKFRKYIFLCVMGYWGIILTQKRGLLICNIIVTIIINIIYNLDKKDRKMKIKRGFIVLLIITVFTIIIIWGVFNNEIINKLLFEEDITTGRIDIYINVLKLIKNNFILGNGIGTVEKVIGIKAHNIYIQVLAEMGIIGLLSYLIALIGTLMISINNFIRSKKNNLNKKIKINLIFSIYIQLIFIFYGLTGNPLYDYFILGIYFASLSLNSMIQTKGRELYYEKKQNRCINIS